jgi:hypothetical protein
MKALLEVRNSLPEFSSFKDLSFWDRDHAIFVWRNMLRIVGNINDYKVS